MKAIQEAGGAGKAKLRSSKDRKKETKKKEVSGDLKSKFESCLLPFGMTCRITLHRTLTLTVPLHFRGLVTLLWSFSSLFISLLTVLYHCYHPHYCYSASISSIINIAVSFKYSSRVAAYYMISYTFCFTGCSSSSYRWWPHEWPLQQTIPKTESM